MKTIYNECKTVYQNKHPFAKVCAYFYDYHEHNEPSNMPALISLEVGKYIEHADFPFKPEKTIWYMIENKDLDEAKVIRKAIEIIDNEWETLINNFKEQLK